MLLIAVFIVCSVTGKEKISTVQSVSLLRLVSRDHNGQLSKTKAMSRITQPPDKSYHLKVLFHLQKLQATLQCDLWQLRHPDR